MSFGNSASHVPILHLWQPDNSFFSRGATTVSIAEGTSTKVAWRFQSIGSGRLPFHFLRCELTADGTTCIGQGYHPRLKISIRQAFAEAWERFWLCRPSSTHNTSNGFAAGATVESAITSSRAELIERAVVLTAWRSMRGWGRHKANSLLAKLLCSGLRANGWRIRLFELREASLGSVLTAIAEHPERGAIFDSVYVGSIVNRRAFESKLLRSITRVAFAGRSKHSEEKITFPDHGSPEDQARFYSQPENLIAFNFLNDPQSESGLLELPEPQEVKTTLLCSISEMPAVAVSEHPHWPVLSWGKESIRGENPWPHPLA